MVLPRARLSRSQRRLSSWGSIVPPTTVARHFQFCLSAYLLVAWVTDRTTIYLPTVLWSNVSIVEYWVSDVKPQLGSRIHLGALLYLLCT